MRAAVIDLGTNTFHLIIADVSENGVQICHKTNVPVRLGEGKINDHVIIPAAFERGIQTLKDFKQQIDQYQVSRIRAIATSAIRSATNGADFVRAAKELAGISIEVISGDQEAELIFNGIKATGMIKETALIMDIGGGSTEFIICNAEEPLWKKSYDLGAARLMQAYFKTDPISKDDQSAIISRLESELAELREACDRYQPLSLVGSAGAFETFASLLLGDIDVKSITSATLDVTAYQALASRLVSSTHEERTHIKDLIPLRVDMIVIASIITSYVLRELNLSALYLSTYDLKMGVLHSMLEQ